jgi:type I restriction enzyme S subunit
MQNGPETELFDYIDISSIDTSSKRISNHKRLSIKSAPSRAKQNVIKGDILVSLTRPNLNAVAFIDERFDGAVASTGFHVLRSVDADPSYLFYFVQSKAFIESLVSRVQGVVYPAARPKDVEQLRIPIAPLSEQRRIVAEIEKQFTLLDAGVKAIQIGLSRLARLRSALLERVFSEFRNTMVPLGDIADVQGGIQKQPKRRPLTNHYPFLRVANVLRGRLTLSDIHEIELFRGELDRLRLEKGDLLIVEGNGSPGEIGRMAIWDGSIPDCVHQNHIIRARLRPGVTPQFLAAYWNSPRGAKEVRSVASSTSGLHTLSVSKVKAIPCPLASEDQQASVVDKLEQVSTVSDVLHASLQAAALRARRLRQSILAKAFSGQLVPQNPTDEPASMLLDRIREQRAKIAIATTRPARRRKPAVDYAG